MILIFNGQVLATATATQPGFAALVQTMHHARETWIKDGKPYSGQFA